MRKVLSIGVLSSLLLIGGSGSAAAKIKIPNPFHKKSAQTKMAKAAVTMEQAQAAALKKVPGTVGDSKTETIKGKEMYWFDISDSKGQKSQVWVNMMGKVTKVTKEKMAKPMTMKGKTSS